MDERSTPEPITSRASYYIEPVDETALADVVPVAAVVVLVLLTVVAIPVSYTHLTLPTTPYV